MGTISFTQFLHPHGRRRMVSTELPDDICELAKDQLISLEKAPYDYSKVVFYSHKKDDHVENELCMIADDVPGEPQRVLAELIKKVAARQHVPEVEL
jgi:hypothetical protein